MNAHHFEQSEFHADYVIFNFLKFTKIFNPATLNA